MQSKGAIKLVAILLLLASLWQLSFTVVSNRYEKKAEKYAEEAVAKKLADSAFVNSMSPDSLASELDTIRMQANKHYLDSIASMEVYLGYTFKQVQSKAINLGLDLKGGMSVTLQVQMQDLVKNLATNPTPEFEKALAAATKRSATSKENFFDIFQNEWSSAKGSQNLSEIFDEIGGSDDNVIAVLKNKGASAYENSYKVLSNRIDRFGVAQPNIQKVNDGSGRILVELPGVKDPERVRKLLQGTASLEFWATHTGNEVVNVLAEADEKLGETLRATDTTASVHPIFDLIQYGPSNSACLGIAHKKDIAKIDEYLKMPVVKEVLKRGGLIPMWSEKPLQNNENMFELVAINDANRNGKPLLDGESVESARAQLANQQGAYEVSMSMTRDGVRKWAKITGDNIGRQVAIVLDGLVQSYPVVNQRIEGDSSISGNFTAEEAQDLANVLECGKLDAPARIIQESVVGPSLGEKSIHAGFVSFVIAFLLVLLYMVVFYNRAGIAADIALLCNVILLMGALVSFGAVLTLPGIAGLVLTLGMAVDANVIIYERVKEELRAGKGLSKAIADGYSNAYSAIIDGQITTLLTGIVLFVFGSGPVQGFATTLIIGIVTSIVTSIFITRIYFEERLAKGKNITFDNKFTRNFLQNTKVDFIGKRKIAYIVSGIIILISLTSMFTKGFTYGIDFVGGRTYVIKFDQKVETEAIRNKIETAFTNAAKAEGLAQPTIEVKQFGGEDQVKITTSFKNEPEFEGDQSVDSTIVELLRTELAEYFKADLNYKEFKSTDLNALGIVSSDRVGAAIAQETKTSAIYSVLIALVIIFAYIAIRFKGWTWGLGGVLGLAHTAIIVIGFFSLFTGILPFTLDIDQTFIAAILTIIGYAINDTVVIFDRIREYKTLHPKADLKQNVNAALNSTLSRTMNTSLTTLVTMLAIAIFGGEAIRGLAVALILGIVIGTYASIFIATPIMYDMTNKSAKKKAKKAENDAVKAE